MYCPHTVSLIHLHGGRPYLTLLRGVMLQAVSGQNVRQRGDAEASAVRLFIPMGVQAVNEVGEQVSFLPPLAYRNSSEPEKHWTLQPEGESAGRCGFFVKGEIPEACSLAEAREKYDEVYVIAGWQLHDYGSPALRHFEVLSRVSGRYYRSGNT